MEELLDQWFKREVLAHEAALVRYLKRKWPYPEEIHDLRQELYVRVYDAAGKARPTAPKSFLFTSARHLMSDRMRRRRIVSIEAVADLDSLNVLVDEISPERHVHAHQELKLLMRALKKLPPRCREVVWMRRVEQVPQKEVASRLGISQRVVEKHVMKGMRLLADAFFGRRSLTGSPASEARDENDEALESES